MSLHDAVKEIADQMDDDSNVGGFDPSVRTLLVGYVRQLRTALKASESIVPTGGLLLGVPAPNSMIGPLPKPARPRPPDDELAFGGRMARLIGHPELEGDHIELPPDAKPGSKPIIAGNVWVVADDGNLHWCEAETAQYREACKKESSLRGKGQVK